MYIRKTYRYKNCNINVRYKKDIDLSVVNILDNNGIVLYVDYYKGNFFKLNSYERTDYIHDFVKGYDLSNVSKSSVLV